MYAAIKRKRVSPLKFLVNHWLELIELKGEIGCTSVITRIATRLGLMTKAAVAYIEEPRQTIDYDYFMQAHILKRDWNQLFMIYVEHGARIRLPNPDLSLYVVNSFLIDLQANRIVPLRTASTRLAYQPRRQWHDADPTPEGPAYTSYAGWTQPKSSHGYHHTQSQWEQPTPQHSEESWPQATSEQW